MIAQRSTLTDRAASAASLYEKLAPLMLRVTLAAAFLSAVADRCGLWGAPGEADVAWGSFESFVQYTALLNPLLPQAAVQVVAVVVTGLEVLLAGLLLIGRFQRAAALASSLLLGTFAIAMTISLGPKAPLDYSVFLAAAGAAALARITANSDSASS